ncbi:uncharacterized protein LOC119281710 isoform X2 [Triticum dicoccoides]|uniref:uncharacterized protein LOC119281710 isoform X2 n=1 Tax=Triticum dicoccoides TaxID=85692 RepID=UPI00188F8F39|nr:uncharacterized protein LOC119281710 isoform X2 [Triticum dicoccoides]
MQDAGLESFWMRSTSFRCERSSRTAWNIQIRWLLRCSRDVMPPLLRRRIRMLAPGAGSTLVALALGGRRVKIAVDGRALRRGLRSPPTSNCYNEEKAITGLSQQVGAGDDDDALLILDLPGYSLFSKGSFLWQPRDRKTVSSQDLLSNKETGLQSSCH